MYATSSHSLPLERKNIKHANLCTYIQIQEQYERAADARAHDIHLYSGSVDAATVAYIHDYIIENALTN